MKYDFLYYPYINIPSGEWLNRILLYSDSVTAMIPENFDPDELTPEMRELLDSGMVRYISPFGDYGTPELISDFIKLLKSDPAELAKRQNAFNEGRRPSSEGWFVNVSLVHVRKLQLSALMNLESLGLCKFMRGNRLWCYMETQTASEILEIIAQTTSMRNDYTPVTDRIPDSLVPKLYKETENEILIEGRRQIILKDLVPTPWIISFHHLRDFKEQHPEELRRFRNAIDKLALLDTFDPGSRSYRICIEELTDTKNDILKVMKKNRFTRVIDFALGVIKSDPVQIGESIFSSRGGIDASGMKYLAIVESRLMRENLKQHEAHGIRI